MPEPGVAMQPVCIVVLLDAIPFDLRVDVFCNGVCVASAKGRGRVLVPCVPIALVKVCVCVCTLQELQWFSTFGLKWSLHQLNILPLRLCLVKTILTVAGRGIGISAAAHRRNTYW